MASPRVRHRWRWLALAACVAAAAIAVAVWAPWKAPAVEYQTAAVRYGDLTRTVSASGTLNPVTVVNVGTQVSGTVQAIYVDYNSRVQRGEVLLRLDPTLFKAQAAQDTANVHSAEANLLLARANEEREQALYKTHYVSAADLDQVVAARKVAEAQLEQARAQLDHDQANLAYTVIRSPIDGVIINREVDVGQTVAASFQTPTLFEIGQNLKQMQIDTTVDEADIGSIKPGEQAKFTVDAYPTRQYSGTVAQVRLNPTTVQNVVTYDVVITVDNADETLLPGMTAYVDIAVATHRHVLLVPNAALRVALAGQRPAAVPGPGQGVIYVMGAAGPEPLTVSVGISDSRDTEVAAAGLAAGAEVLVGIGGNAGQSRSRSMFQTR